ncbi:conserved hypothetical protein [Altererythrobacter sp. B11]|uniref:YcgN family cysteine cluster protein n=1 Tax=Altererythrobacter sp. B11 TaxID=2060312 RepID=UPI000DC6F59E|nr:YcgN family cysteine cluster protein [Altererythrobacter sp. B11]BBC71996.1 conserved hypothetical protein [Altererythrobacter sp. B11]
MGELRDRFWELPLDALNRAEWEALCDGCGRCCLHKLEDEETGAIAETNVACKLLNTATARCSDYRHRKAFVPDCLRLTPRLVAQINWLPESCAYVRRARGQPLPRWHHLLTGSDEAMKRAGASVAGRVVSETDAGPLEHHVIEWERG